MRADDERITFTWYRGKEMWKCSCFHCRLDRGCVASEDPMRSHGRVPVQCTDCAKAGAPVAPSLFCSPKCMKKSWSSHCHSRHPPKPVGDSKRPELRRDPDEDEDQQQIAEVELLPPTHPDDGDDWVEVGSGKYVLLLLEGSFCACHDLVLCLRFPERTTPQRWMLGTSLSLSPRCGLKTEKW